MSENIIIDVKLSNKPGSLKAFVTVTLQTELGEVTISRFMIFQKEGEEARIVFPQIQYLDKEKKQQYADVLIDCRKFKSALSELILAEYHRKSGK